MASPITVPYDMHAAPTPSLIFFAFSAVFFAVSLWWVFREHTRTGTWIAGLALVGGAISALEEPWINASILLWYPKDAPAVVFTIFDHHQPLYIYLVYPGFVGLGAYVVYRGLVSHPDGRLISRAWWAIVVMDLAFELPATSLSIFRYYGPQPFQLADGLLPLWVPFINATGPALAGVLIYLLEPRLAGKWRLLLALMPPLAYAGVYAAVGWPTYTALNSDAPTLVRAAVAVVTVALCGAIVVSVRFGLKTVGNRTSPVLASTTEGAQ